MNEKRTDLTTGLVRTSYCHLWEAVASEDGGEAKYSVSLLIPKTDTKTITAINEAINNALENGKDKLGKVAKAKINLPLRDGDTEKPDDEAYKGMYFINAKNSKQPTIVDARVQPILVQDEVYSGCWGKANISFFPYAYKNMSFGIGCSIRAFQKIKDDTSLGGGTVRAEDVFSVEEADDDMPW